MNSLLWIVGNNMNHDSLTLVTLAKMTEFIMRKYINVKMFIDIHIFEYDDSFVFAIVTNMTMDCLALK
jgi:hypothetical protein